MSSSTDACEYHPGAPIFHDAYKGWSCCNKKSTDFTTFLNTKVGTQSIYLFNIFTFTIINLYCTRWNSCLFNLSSLNFFSSTNGAIHYLSFISISQVVKDWVVVGQSLAEPWPIFSFSITLLVMRCRLRMCWRAVLWYIILKLLRASLDSITSFFKNLCMAMYDISIWTSYLDAYGCEIMCTGVEGWA